MPHPVGTLAWAQVTQGKLTLRDKLTLLADATRAQIAAWMSRQPTPIPFDLDRITIPDSALAQQTLAYCESVYRPPLFLHVTRTYFWASILGHQTGLTFDPELLFVMAQLHDISLSENYKPEEPAACFAVEGGATANAFCSAHGCDETRAQQIQEAIILHMNVSVPTTYGTEAHLMQAGTALDVIGLRKTEIAPETHAALLARYPREGWLALLEEKLGEQVRRRPDSRIAFFYAVGNFRGRMRSVG